MSLSVAVIRLFDERTMKSLLTDFGELFLTG